MHQMRYKQHRLLFLLILVSGILLLRVNFVTASPTPVSTPETIYAALNKWQNAWQQLDANSYISSYSPDFTGQQFTSHERWASSRQQRLESQQWVKLKLSGIVIYIRHDGKYIAKFTQHYKSDSFSEVSRKQLLFEKYEAGWLIVSEHEIEN